MTPVLVIAAGCLVALAGTPNQRLHGEPGTTAPVARADGRSPSPQSLESAIQQVLQRATPCVVRVWFGGDGDMLTGTVISDDGLVLTCAHLPVPVGGDVQIGLMDGRRAPALVLSKLPEAGQSNIGMDLAILQITVPGPRACAAVATRSPVVPDELVLALGFPDTLLYGADRAADPMYVRLGHPVNDPYQIQPGQLTTSIAGSGGDSGGPLFDLSGRLVGVVHGGDGSGAHLNHTRIEILRQHWDRLAPGKTPPPIPNTEPVVVVPVESLSPVLRDSVVEVRSDARWIGLGCIVGDGLILTKSSELGPNLTVALANDYVAIAEVAATDPVRDLALLRLPYAPELTKGAKAVPWNATDPVNAGTPVLLATPGYLSPLLGVTCFDQRPVSPIAGCIPCEVEDTDKGVRIAKVIDEQRVFRLRPLPLALRVGDIITAIEGIPIHDRVAFITRMFDSDRIGSHPLVSGEPVRVSYRRGQTTNQCTVVLEFCNSPSGQLVRPVSNRYSGFPSAIATDLAVRPEHCGAPVVDTQGRTVGILIARAPFIETLVLPAGEVAESLKHMIETASEKQPD